MSDVVEFDPKKRRRARPLPAGWESGLLKSREGTVKKLAANVELILNHAPEWRGAISWDEFAERIVVRFRCPAGAPGPWTDLHDTQTAIWLQRSVYRLEASPDLVASAVRAVAEANAVHPLRERLKALRWDGVNRLDTWTSKYLGAEDTEVHREMGKRWLLGAVERVFNPGAQADTALILEGAQGLGKSTAARILSLGFFTDELADLGSKDAAMQLHGAWIVELPELDAMGRAETSRVKAFLTRRSDRYRAPYGRHVAEHPRQCVFIGTVNHNDYLKDETGGRRFSPIEARHIDIQALRGDVEQLWAEVIHRRANGESTYTSDARLRSLIVEIVSERYQGDAWTEIVREYAQTFKNVSVTDCLKRVGVEQSRWNQPDANRIAKILKSLGYRRKYVWHGGHKEWRYLPEGAAIPPAPDGQTGSGLTIDDSYTNPLDPVNSVSGKDNGGEDRSCGGLIGTSGSTGSSGSPDFGSESEDEFPSLDDLLPPD